MTEVQFAVYAIAAVFFAPPALLAAYFVGLIVSAVIRAVEARKRAAAKIALVDEWLAQGYCDDRRV